MRRDLYTKKRRAQETYIYIKSRVKETYTCEKRLTKETTGLFSCIYATHMSNVMYTHAKEKYKRDLHIWKETYKRNLQMRPTGLFSCMYATHMSKVMYIHAKEKYKRDLYIWKETYKRDLQKRPTGLFSCILGSKNRIWVCAHFPKNTALNPAQAKLYVSNAGFWELRMTKKINLRGIKGDGFHPPKLSFGAFFHIFQKIFYEKIQKECPGHH